MTPKVSVIIPAYQDAEHIGAAVDSALAQTYPDREVIVVDDGSTDDTLRVLSAYGDAIRVISQPNRGPSAARNLGIQQAQGEWVAFLDADDVWLPEKLALQMPLFQKGNGVGLVCSDTYFVDSLGLRPRTGFMDNSPCSGRVLKTIFTASFIPTSTVVVRKACLDQVGGFDGSLRACEDLDLWLRIAAEWEIDFVPEPLAHYRISEGQLSSQRVNMLKGLVTVLDRAYQRWPELRALSRAELDGSYYAAYLRLASAYLRAGQFKEVRQTLANYHQKRGMTWQSLVLWGVSLLPKSLGAAAARTLQKIRARG